MHAKTELPYLLATRPLQIDNILIKFQDADGGTEPVALLSDFGCAVNLRGSSSAPYRGSRKSLIPEVAESKWAAAWAQAAAHHDGARPDHSAPVPHVTAAADVWLLGAYVLPRLLGELPEGVHASVHAIVASCTHKTPKNRPTMQALRLFFSTFLHQAAGTA